MLNAVWPYNAIGGFLICQSGCAHWLWVQCMNVVIGVSNGIILRPLNSWGRSTRIGRWRLWSWAMGEGRMLHEAHKCLWKKLILLSARVIWKFKFHNCQLIHISCGSNLWLLNMAKLAWAQPSWRTWKTRPPGLATGISTHGIGSTNWRRWCQTGVLDFILFSGVHCFQSQCDMMQWILNSQARIQKSTTPIRSMLCRRCMTTPMPRRWSTPSLADLIGWWRASEFGWCDLLLSFWFLCLWECVFIHLPAYACIY